MAGLPRAGVQLVADDSVAFQSAMRDASQAVTDFGQTAERAGGGVSSFGQIATGALRQVGTIAVDAAVQGAKAIGGFVVDAVSQAGNFESGMNRFASITGSAIADAGMELEDFSALFLKLGADTQFSAAQAQEAAINLAKGGLDPATIAGGALADTLTLAAAGELELAAAAEITAKQLGVWASTGVTSAEVANLLSQAANASTVDVEELALGLANVGGIAKTAGLSFRELNVSMALLAPGFSSAADAGTSFKTFLTRLQPSTAPATEAMAKLGLLTEEGTSKFYDAAGSFIGMEAAADLLQKSLAGLSEAEKVATLQAWLGQDAFRAGALLGEKGAAGYLEMSAAMDAAGTAAEQAAEKNKGWNFALETLLGSIDTLKIVLGTALLPLLTSFVTDTITPAINGVMAFASAFQALVPHIFAAADPMNAFFNALKVTLPEAIPFISGVQNAFNLFAPAISAVMTAAQPLIDLLSANLVPVLGAVATVLGAGLLVALGGVVAGFAAVAAPVAAAVAVLAVLYANIGPIQEALQRFGNTEWGQALQRGAAVAGEYFSGPFVSQVTGGVSAIQSSLNTLAASSWGQDFQRGAQVAGDYFAGPFASELAAGVGVVQGKLQELGASQWGQALSQGAQVTAQLFVQAMTLIVSTVSNSLQQVAGFAQSHAAEFQAIFSGAWNSIVALVTGGTQALLGIVRAAMQALEGDWTGAWQTIKATTSALVQANVDAIRSALEALPAVVSTIFDAVVSTISGFVGQFSSVGSDLIEGLADGIRGAASSAIDAAVDAATGALEAAKSALGIESPSREAAEQVGTPFVMGIVEGIEESAHLLEDMARQLSEQLVDDMAAVGEAAAEAFKDMFTSGLEGTASIARQKVKNLRDTDKLAKTASKEEDPYKRDQLQMIAGSTQKQLSDAEAFAATFADPKLGAKYFKEESARIIELAELKQQYIQATTNTEKAALTQQMRLIEEAQAAERALFAATAEEQSKTFDETQEALQTVLDKLKYEAQRDLGISKLDIGKENQASAYAEYEKDLEAIKKIEALIAAIQAGIAGGLGDAVTASLKSTLEAAVRQAKDTLGISSPSKVFAKEVGEPSGEGLVKGFASMLPDMNKALTSSLTTQSMVRPPASAGQIAQSGAANTTNTSNWNFSYMTQQSMGSVQQDIAVAQALAGV